MVTDLGQSVSIHTPVQGATCLKKDQDHQNLFQSTLPYRERPGSASRSCGTLCFNPHSRTGSDRVWRHVVDDDLSFNPHSRTGSDIHTHDNPDQTSVSIHTPVQGATMNDLICARLRHVSIHTPVQGATNPHSRTGSDARPRPRGARANVSIHTPVQGATPSINRLDTRIRVSIHTPVQGATSCCDQQSQLLMFQSTLPYRERPTSLSAGWPTCTFQSTLPYRERPARRFLSDNNSGFNPHSRTGSDSEQSEPLRGKGLEAQKCESLQLARKVNEKIGQKSFDPSYVKRCECSRKNM